MRMLFLCNTIYQIIGASSIRNMYLEHDADIILSDHSTGNKKIYDSFIEKKLIFNRAYYVESKYLYDNDKNMTFVQRMAALSDDNEISSILKIDDKYDFFFCANVGPFSERMVNYLKRRNPDIKVCWFEDGTITYSCDQRYFRRGVKGKVVRWIKKLKNICEITDTVKQFYVFKPENMEWIPNAALKKISPINNQLVTELGIVFGVNDCVDVYDKKYIFFEDGYIDWDEGEDIRIVQELASVVGKENIMVRIHPRNPRNRFAELGYKTNQDTSIPWEILAMNIDIQDKVLITMYSQSVLTPDILLGKKAKSLILCKLEKNFENSDHMLFDYMNRRYYSKDRANYIVPENMEQLNSIVKEF